MQKIFETYQEEFEGRCLSFVKIYVMWKNEILSLIDLLKIWEKPFTKPVGGPRPGAYYWIPPAALYGELMVEPDSRNYRTVLECECGCSGCWPFQVVAEATKEQVIWTKYLQPHRNKKSLGGFWDYSIYPPLIFDKQQYYDELQPMKPIYEEWTKQKKKYP
jgi:hypothetical protein